MIRSDGSGHARAREARARWTVETRARRRLSSVFSYDAAKNTRRLTLALFASERPTRALLEARAPLAITWQRRRRRVGASAARCRRSLDKWRSANEHMIDNDDDEYELAAIICVHMRALAAFIANMRDVRGVNVKRRVKFFFHLVPRAAVRRYDARVARVPTQNARLFCSCRRIKVIN